MTSRNSIVANAINACAKNAGRPSQFFAAYAGKAKAAIGEIQHEAEGELRVLSEVADDLSAKARAAGDAEGWNLINRCQVLLEDALANYVRISLRTVG
jgi:hypothetical protein